MVSYFCINCKKEFNKKSNYLNHIQNKKKPCLIQKLNSHQNAQFCTEKTPKSTEKTLVLISNTEQKEYNDINNNINNNYICNFCNTSFTRSTTLKRHLLERCKISPRFINFFNKKLINT